MYLVTVVYLQMVEVVPFSEDIIFLGPDTYVGFDTK